MIYLDNSATSRYKPLSVKRALLHEVNNSANPGRSGHSAAIRSAAVVEKCREEICKNIFDGNVVFTKNCTEALNLAIFGINPTGQVITTVYEHNSVLRPLKSLENAGKISLKIIDHSDEGSLIKSLQTPTSLVVMTAMSNVTGKSFDVSSLAKIIKARSSSKILVDMAQGGGHIKPDMQYIDMCAFAGHKSLHGVQGTGFLCVKYGIELSARILGGTGTSSLNISHPNTIPDGMEAGTLNTPGIAALREGIRWTYKNFDRINDRCEAVANRIYEGLHDMKNVNLLAANNSIILFNVNGVPAEKIADFLNEKHGVAVRSGLHCAPLAHRHIGTAPFGAVRISVGFNNDLYDAEKAVEAIKDAVTKFCPKAYNTAKERHEHT